MLEATTTYIPAGQLEDALASIRHPVLYTHVGHLELPGRRRPVQAAYAGESGMEAPHQARPASSLRKLQARQGFQAHFTVVTCLPRAARAPRVRRIAEAQALADLGDLLMVRNTHIGAETQLARVLRSGRDDLIELAGHAGRAHARAVIARLAECSEPYLRGGESIREKYLWTARILVGPQGGIIDLEDVTGLLAAREPERWATRAFPHAPIRRDFAVREARALPFPRATYHPTGRAHIHPWPMDLTAAADLTNPAA